MDIGEDSNLIVGSLHASPFVQGTNHWLHIALPAPSAFIVGQA